MVHRTLIYHADDGRLAVEFLVIAGVQKREVEQ